MLKIVESKKKYDPKIKNDILMLVRYFLSFKKNV